jgi:hypothetical protein
MRLCLCSVRPHLHIPQSSGSFASPEPEPSVQVLHPEVWEEERRDRMDKMAKSTVSPSLNEDAERRRRAVIWEGKSNARIRIHTKAQRWKDTNIEIQA